MLAGVRHLNLANTCPSIHGPRDVREQSTPMAQQRSFVTAHFGGLTLGQQLNIAQRDAAATFCKVCMAMCVAAVQPTSANLECVISMARPWQWPRPKCPDLPPHERLAWTNSRWFPFAPTAKSWPWLKLRAGPVLGSFGVGTRNSQTLWPVPSHKPFSSWFPSLKPPQSRTRQRRAGHLSIWLCPAKPSL